MDLTEEKAKEILDFLAKKQGCLNIEAKCTCPSDYWNIGCIYRNHFGAINFLLLSYDNSLFGKHVKSKTLSYKSFLNNMLKKSRDGHVVKTFGLVSPFLPAYSNLYNILVEMDLSCV